MIASVCAAAVMFGATAQADPPTEGTTRVDMPMPGSIGAAVRGGADDYTPPWATLTVQDGSPKNADGVAGPVTGAGIDRDGTNGTVNRTGTDGVFHANGMEGRLTGPLMHASPQFRAAAAPGKPRP